MTTTTLRIPKAAVSMQEGTLAAWLVADGESVVEGQPIYTLEIEKSTMDVEAPATGVLRHVGTSGATYKVGEIIGEIGTVAVNRATDAAGPIDAGGLYHTGYVVADIQVAIRHWIRLAGAGPFVLFEDFEFVNPTYRGAPVSLKATLAFGYSGDSCIELIQPSGPGPSIYTEMAGSMHHIGMGVENLEASLQAYAMAGVECAFKAAFAFGGGCAYLDTRDTLGVFTELVERGAAVDEMIRQMLVAHRNWNRRDLTFTLG